MTEGSTSKDDGHAQENGLEYYRRRCSELEIENVKLKGDVARLASENAKMREELASLKTTVSAVVARSVGAKASIQTHRYRKAGRRSGHEGATRSRPEHVDVTVELDQSVCHRCGGVLSERPTDSYTRVVEDIVPAKRVVTEYVVRRRYCRGCGEQVSPPVPNVIGGGGNERFGLRLMLLVVSLKLLGLSYAKVGSLLKLLFALEITEAAMIHCVKSVASAFGPRYEELRRELLREKSIHGDETGWPIKGRNHWLWAFVGRWSVVYEVADSRGKDVPQRVLGDYKGTVISDSWPAWNHVGARWQRCLVHYLRELKETIEYKSPGAAFFPFAKRLRRILNDAIRVAKRTDVPEEERLRVKARLERRVDTLIESCSSSADQEKNCSRLVKRLKRERGMLFTFLDEKEGGIAWNNNAAERALRPSVVIRKMTYGNQSEEGARAHAILMSVKETCNLRGENFFDYSMGYLDPTSTR
jgi:transposase